MTIHKLVVIEHGKHSRNKKKNREQKIRPTL